MEYDASVINSDKAELSTWSCITDEGTHALMKSCFIANSFLKVNDSDVSLELNYYSNANDTTASMF
jgi:hypothetical protein